MTAAAKVGVTGIDATYYMTKDLAAATTFYTNLFGSEPGMHMPDMVSEWTFAGGESFGLYQPPDKGEWHPGAGVLFHVGDIGAAVEASKALGATFEEHPDETPICFMAFGADPEGNRFILHQPK